MTPSATPATEANAVLETAPPEVKAYQRQKRRALLAGLAIDLAVLVLAALWLGPHVDRSMRDLLGDAGENRWLRLIFLGGFYSVLLELLTLPISFWSGYVLEHRYGLSNQTLGAWLSSKARHYLVGGVIGLLLLLGFYAILWTTGRWWWLAATAGWLAFTVVLGRLLPVLILPIFYKITPLDDPAMAERLRRLFEGTGLKVEGVYRWHLSEETKKANAALAGLGSTRRVLLGDTLLEQFTPEEIEVVFAHEVGHHVYRHLTQFIVVSVALAAAGFGLLAWLWEPLAVALGYPGTPELPAYADPAALPLFLLLVSGFGLLLAPAQNALSRFYERQCDRYALRRTGNAAAFRSAFAKLARLNKSDPDPHPVVVWLFYDHPPIRHRLALADEVPGT